MVATALSRIIPVDLVTSDFDHLRKSRRSLSSCSPFQRVTCLHATSYRNNVSAARLISHILFGLRAAIYFLRYRDAYDVVFVTLPLNMLAWLVLLLAGHRKRIVDIVDVWPDVLPFSSAMKRLLRPALSIWKWFFKASIFKADLVMAVSDTFMAEARTFAATSAQFGRFYIGQELFEASVPKQRMFTLAYIGNIGQLYDFENLIDVLSDNDLRDHIQLFVIGDGDRRDWLLAELRRRDIRHRYWGVVYDPSQLASILRSCHAGFNGYRQTTASFSYKATSYLAAGLPLLNSMTGDLHQLVQERGFGENYQSENRDELRACLLSMYRNGTERMAKNCEEFFAECLKKDRILNDLERLLTEFLSESNPQHQQLSKDTEGNLNQAVAGQICKAPRGAD